MKLKPAYERVLVDVIPPKELTEGGLMIPDDGKEPSTTGIVIDFGEEVPKFISKLKPGDKIMFIRYSGMEVVIDGKAYRLIMANDILGIIVND